MKILFLVVGKTINPKLQELIDEYINRLKHYVSFDFKFIPELRNTKNLSFDEQKMREGEFILKSINPTDNVILLDERGNEYRSVDFAQQLNKWMMGSNIVFVVGGPYGFSKDVYDRANSKLAISKMTFSHQMIRLLFVEQLYRAFTILNHEPYHHE